MISTSVKQTVIEVGMTCDGCANAVKRILGKIDGVSIETNVEEKKAIVTHGDDITPQELVDKLMPWSKASGKSVNLPAN
eukprot:CAMPEP_0194164674 /NCGR_PEP_ID=MMETSP0154-20130528/763_1 /TAXON_ID=1049557 /ORGANISM="Thalassiothrix antarctica, Strain L6-D1" /LENGTH=78 /DNA_ID=CAMNT_0038874917 /DNA_START=32 /DNA_END=268 /DNA_ORIENTATION=+